MATRFGGFTPQQQQVLLSLAGYQGPAQQDDLNKFMMASPKAASMMGRYTEMAKARVQGGPQTAMQVGGYMAPPMPMQQQPMMPPLDYNRLYAQPNMQQQQQPIAMQTGGMAPNTTGGFDTNPFGEDTRGQGVTPQPMGDTNPLTGQPIGTGPADGGPPPYDPS